LFLERQYSTDRKKKSNKKTNPSPADSLISNGIGNIKIKRNCENTPKG
jgi:hypothetical protein